MEDYIDLHGSLGANASIPYNAVKSCGPPSRPLEFPAPIVDRSVTVSADIINHRTGNPFHATSVLMRMPHHSKSCASRAVPSLATSNSSSSFDSAIARSTQGNGRYRTRDPDRIHSWHPVSSPTRNVYYDPQHCQVNSNSSNTATSRSHSSHSHNRQPPPCCGPSCSLPDRAYCVTRKICNTTYGSIRLCIVLKRVSKNIIDYAKRSMDQDQYHHHHSRSLPNNAKNGREGNKYHQPVIPTWQTTDEMVAIKVVNWAKLNSLRGRHLEDPIKELAALQQLVGNYHPHINPIQGALQSESHLYCIYPYVAGGDLYGCLLDKMETSENGRIDEELARTWFRQILSAISHLQKKGVCHRDISLENMMVDEDDNIRLIDFGLSLRVPFADPNNRNLSTDVSANTTRRLIKTQGQCGKLEYMAPEIAMRSEEFDGFAIDLWAAGLVLFELLVGKKPFLMPDPVDKNFHSIAVKGELSGLLKAKGIEVSDKAVDLLQKMLWLDPAKRLTLSEIVNHPWVQGDQRNTDPSSDNILRRNWFIRNDTIDDMGETKLTNLLLCRDSTAGSMASTAGTSDAESQNAMSQPSSSDDTLPCSTPKELESREDGNKDEEKAAVDVLKEINPHQKKTSCWLSRLKAMKWRRSDS